MKPFFAAALAAAGVISLLAGVAPALADDYPSRTITIVVPYPPGGPTDETARVVAHSLSQIFKQNVVVENVTGGGTIIATNKVAKATPDGYTLLLHNLQITANVTLYKNLPFDTEKDLTPVIMINRNPLLLVGRNTLAANTLAELIAEMKKGRMKAAIPGYGATGHLTTTLLAQELKVKLDQIPYRGAAPALNDLLGGHVDLFIATPQQIVQQVKAGKVKAFGITSKQPLPELPKLESLVKVLGPKFNVVFWQGLFAPSGTPKDVIAKLNAAMQQTVSDPTIVKRWAGEGVSTFPKNQRSLAASAAFMKSEIARWGEVIRDNNIHVNQ
jgi:tripartite-type tricarboxylate transporter receptor subunit TctC